MGNTENNRILFEAVRRASLKNANYRNIRSDGSVDPTVIHGSFVIKNLYAIFKPRIETIFKYTHCFHNGVDDLFFEYKSFLNTFDIPKHLKDKWLCGLFGSKDLQIEGCKPFGDYKYEQVGGKVFLKGTSLVEGSFQLKPTIKNWQIKVQNMYEESLRVSSSSSYSYIVEDKLVNGFYDTFHFTVELDLNYDVSKHPWLKEDYARFLKKEGFYGLK